MQNNTFTAEITAINNDDWDEITIYRDGEVFDQIEVESSEDTAPYDAAVSEAIDGAEFTWLPSIF